MVKGIYHSAAELLACQKQLEVVANNLANASTVSFKRTEASFTNALDSSMANKHPLNVAERFVELSSGKLRVLQQGPLRETGNPLDVALKGEGFFVVERGGKTAYSRNGSFQLNQDGELVTLNGDRVVMKGNSQSLPNRSLQISSNGQVYVENPAQATNQILDSLQVVTFPDPGQLCSLGDGLYATEQEPIEIPEVQLEVGYLEDSNVNVVEEMVEMILLNRCYDAAAHAIQAQDQTIGKAVNEVGRVP
ncbi:MAG: flagellar hook-basal body protein [bacterium]